MAGGITSTPWNGPARRSLASSQPSADRHPRDLTWISLGLGTAAFMAGLGGRKGTMAVALTALAGAVALDQLNAVQHGRGQTAGKERSASNGKSKVERSITIGKSSDQLQKRWRDPETVSRVFAGVAGVRPMGDGRLHWTIEGPFGSPHEWDSETTSDRSGDGIGWRSLPGAAVPNEGSIRFRPAPADRGTVATLRFSFDPPGGVLSAAVVELLDHWPLGLAVDAVLRRFKSLVETGEIPTTERQPAARADTR